MAVEKVGSSFTLPAAGDLSGDQFKFVRVDFVFGKVLVAFTEDDPVLGVLQNKPNAIDEPASIWGIGSVSKVVAGEAITTGDHVKSSDAGLALVAVTAVGDYIVGTALSSAALNELVTVWITQPGKTPPI